MTLEAEKAKRLRTGTASRREFSTYVLQNLHNRIGSSPLDVESPIQYSQYARQKAGVGSLSNLLKTLEA